MTDELDPRPEAMASDPAAQEVTTRVETPSAPVTPADRSMPGTTVHEDDVTWASPQPVVPTAAPPRRGGRLRWAAAIAVVAVVLGASVAVAALVTGSATSSVVLGYVPVDAVMYGEVRLDLPGDQRQAVGSFLQKFPGFADQASLDSKLDEALDDLIRSATDGDQTYTADIKPWFGGEIGFGAGPLPVPSDSNGSAMASSRGLAIVSVTDGDAAASWIAAAIAESGAKTTPETYQGTTINVADDVDGLAAGYAIVDGKVAVFGDLASVKAAIDSNGNSGFASEPGPKAALASVDGDYVGFGYLALKPLIDWSSQLTDAMVSDPALTPDTAALTATMSKFVPDWTAYWLRFESDALVIEGSAPQPETQVGPTQNGKSAVIDHVPGDAIVAVTSNDVGATIEQLLDVYASDPTMSEMLDGLDQGLGLVGGKDSAIGWIGDIAVVLEAQDGNPAGGVIIAPTDEDAAQQLLTTIKTFISLGGSQAGVSVSEESYNGATITTVDLSGIDGLMAAGMPIEAGTAQISFSLADGVVVIGSGPKFVKQVIDTTASTSLAADSTWSHLSDQVGPSTSTMFVDVSAIRGLIEDAMADADPSSVKGYDKDVKPFLTPFDALFAAGSVDGDLTRSNLIVTVH
jgi:Protein of unknown function (DUF3352)